MGGRHKLSQTITSPGPGAYNSQVKDLGPKYSMGYRPTRKLNGDNPGPGNYDPDYHKTKPRAGVAGFGTGKRGGDHANPTPGPGAYTQSVKRDGPAYHIGG